MIKEVLISTWYNAEKLSSPCSLLYTVGVSTTVEISSLVGTAKTVWSFSLYRFSILLHSVGVSTTDEIPSLQLVGTAKNSLGINIEWKQYGTVHDKISLSKYDKNPLRLYGYIFRQ